MTSSSVAALEQRRNPQASSFALRKLQRLLQLRFEHGHRRPRTWSILQANRRSRRGARFRRCACGCRSKQVRAVGGSRSRLPPPACWRRSGCSWPRRISTPWRRCRRRRRSSFGPDAAGQRRCGRVSRRHGGHLPARPDADIAACRAHGRRSLRPARAGRDDPLVGHGGGVCMARWDTGIRLRLRRSVNARHNPFRIGTAFTAWRRRPDELYVPVRLTVRPHPLVHCIAALVRRHGGSVEIEPPWVTIKPLGADAMGAGRATSAPPTDRRCRTSRYGPRDHGRCSRGRRSPASPDR